MDRATTERRKNHGGSLLAVGGEGVQGYVQARQRHAEHEAGAHAAPTARQTRQGVAAPTQFLLQRPHEQRDDKCDWDEQARGGLELEPGVIANHQPMDAHGHEGHGNGRGERQRVPLGRHPSLQQRAEQSANPAPAFVNADTHHAGKAGPGRDKTHGQVPQCGRFTVLWRRLVAARRPRNGTVLTTPTHLPTRRGGGGRGRSKSTSSITADASRTMRRAEVSVALDEFAATPGQAGAR